MSITYVLSTLQRRWLTVVLALLVGALVGAVFAQATPDRYEATTSLVVTPVISNPMTGSSEDVNIRTEQEILGSREVSRRATEALDLPSDGGAALRADVEVAAPLGSQILQVTVRASSPEKAAEGADALAAAYLDLRRETAAKVTERYVAGVDQQIEDLRAAQPTAATDGLLESLQQQRSSIALTDPNPGQIIGSAVPPLSPAEPGLLITVAGGAMAGLLLGVAAAVLRERTDPWVRSPDRLEIAVGSLPIVASRKSDERFWVQLADESIRLSRVDTDTAPVRVLVHAVAPMRNRVVAEKLLSAGRWVLSDPRTRLSWSNDKAEVESEQVATSVTCRMAVMPSGPFHSSLTRAARHSDVALVAATPRTSLTAVTDAVLALRECGLEVVVGLSEEPPAPDAAPEPARKRSGPKRHRARDGRQRDLTEAPVGG